MSPKKSTQEQRQPQGFEGGSYQDGTGVPRFSGGGKNQLVLHSRGPETSATLHFPSGKIGGDRK